MKTLLILGMALASITSANAKQYVAQISHIESMSPTHSGVEQIKEVLINTTEKTVTIKLGALCTHSNYCPEMLKKYDLKLNQKRSGVFQAEGLLPLQNAPGFTPNTTVITLEKTENNNTVILLKDASGSSTLLASPLQETGLLF